MEVGWKQKFSIILGFSLPLFIATYHIWVEYMAAGCAQTSYFKLRPSGCWDGAKTDWICSPSSMIWICPRAPPSWTGTYYIQKGACWDSISLSSVTLWPLKGSSFLSCIRLSYSLCPSQELVVKGQIIHGCLNLPDAKVINEVSRLAYPILPPTLCVSFQLIFKTNQHRCENAAPSNIFMHMSTTEPCWWQLNNNI